MTNEELLDLMKEYDAEQRIEEIVWFYRAVEEIKPKVIVEIGIKEGGNLKILSTHLPKKGIVVGIDPREEIPWKMKDCLCESHHISLNSHSEEAVSKLEEILDGKPIDVLFIDGDHSTEGMVADYNDYSPLVRKGGIIAVHDIFYLPTVTAAWEQVSKDKKKYESKHIQSSIGIGYLVKE